MAWVSPYTWTVAEVLTAAKLNEQLRDNMKGGRQRITNRRTSGNITVNGTSWANLDTGLDATLAASASDIVEFAVSAIVGNEVVDAYFDAACVASGTQFGRSGATETGITGLYSPTSIFTSISGGADRTLVSGDTSGGNAIIRARVRTSTATNKTVNASTTNELLWMARDHGPHVTP